MKCWTTITVQITLTWRMMMTSEVVVKPGTLYEIDRRDGKWNVFVDASMLTTFLDYDENHWKVLSVEEGAGRKKELLVGETSSVRVYYITLPDLFVLVDKTNLVPVDHKTKDYIDPRLQHQFNPHLQTCGYIWAARYF